MIANRAAIALIVPSVEPEETTTEIGLATTRVLTVPLPSVAERKSSVVAFNVSVSAFAATVALMDWICLVVAST